MSLEQSWQSLDAAAQKYGVAKSSLLAWLEEGILRSEVDAQGVLRVNLDDLELKIHELTKL
jgi:predicted site-specific integrase-resolvase